MAKQMKSNVSVDVNTSAKDVNTRSVSENSPELYDVPKPQASAGLDYDIPKPHHPEIKEEVYDQPRLNRTPERLSLDKIQQHDDAATLTRESERISQKPKTIDSPKPKTTDSPFEADGTKTIKKFPLLSKSRAITEENSIMGIPGDDDKNSGTKFAKTSVEIDDKTNLKSQKSPERRPKPPRNKEFTPIGIYENTRAAEIKKQSLEKSPTVKISSSDQQHYGVRNVMSGEFDVYAKPAGSNINVSKSFRLQPPELPPRNTPQSSPRSSVVHFATNTDKSVNSNEVGIMNMDSMSCARCDDGFEPKAKIVNSNGELYHPECFVCAQCFRPFPDGVFYEFEGRKYCEHDFHVLFAPCCGKCGEFIIGRVIKAMMATWHPQCFTCEMCHKELADLGFIKNQGRALCHECNAKVKAEGVGKYMCQKCHSVIDGEPLRFRGEVYHPYHYNCAACGSELTSTAREVRTRPGYTANELNELYCLRCHDKMGIPICGACRRPIEERVVTALGKHWHVEHFVCAKCEKPFLGNRHYERKGLAYCETHYHQLFGNLCYVCNQVIQGDVFTALNKAWCVNHFACSSCDQKMTVKTKFYEVDLKPVCKKCYDRYPRELRLRLKRYHENEAARDQGTPIAASK